VSWSLLRCPNGHEMNAVRKLDVCAHPKCDAVPVAVQGPLAPKKEKAK
jgi:hypothetical protein